MINYLVDTIMLCGSVINDHRHNNAKTQILLIRTWSRGREDSPPNHPNTAHNQISNPGSTYTLLEHTGYLLDLRLITKEEILT